ncbi:hypothetical protein NP233_g1261 [Leucocoprinus birnbaumii]|uniref:Uncharacterized protein n=1 Tax=Leucocoprinus birnbaumii TaxID=56174 RepID=A0AAD5YZR8_9AGAR|nr:hypothetical protein NP233_g1261 [Leucocoprinus birnbaumii]
MPTHAFVVSFDVVVLVGVLLLVFALLPAVLSRNVSRSVGWYSLMAGWFVYTLSYGLVIGYQEGDVPPPSSLCVTQTLLIYAGPTLVATSFLCHHVEVSPKSRFLSHRTNLKFQFYLIISGLREGHTRPPSQLRTFLNMKLIGMPWVVFLINIVAVSFLIFFGNHLREVELAPTQFYCHLSNSIPQPISSTITGAIVAGVTGIVIPLEGLANKTASSLFADTQSSFTDRLDRISAIQELDRISPPQQT